MDLGWSEINALHRLFYKYYCEYTPETKHYIHVAPEASSLKGFRKVFCSAHFAYI